MAMITKETAQQYLNKYVTISINSKFTLEHILALNSSSVGLK
jgi:hypothetical protein